MKITKETSELFNYRINHIVDKHLSELKNSLKNKDFNSLAEIIIKDSNNLHACCRDSYPTINYLNEESEYIIKGVIYNIPAFINLGIVKKIIIIIIMKK